MKKKIAIIVAVVLVLSLSVAGIWTQTVSQAANAQMYIELPENIVKEKEFTVCVVLDSNVSLYSIDAYMSYNSELLEFVPKDDKVTGAEGVLEIKDTYEEETQNVTYEITFKALEVGTAEVSLTDVYLIDYADLDYITVAPSVKTFEIGVNNAEEENAKLAELIVAPGTLTEEFSPNVMSYEMHVGLDVAFVGVSAIPMSDECVVDLDIPTELLLGKNVITIIVTAPSGHTNTYTITVYREENASTEMISAENSEEITSEESITETNTEIATEENTTEASTEVTTEVTTQEMTETNTEVSTEASTEENAEAITTESSVEVVTDEPTTDLLQE